MNWKKVLIYGAILAVLGGLCFLGGYLTHRRWNVRVIERVDTVCVVYWRRDTIKIKVPQIQTRHDTVLLREVGDTIVRSDTIYRQVEVPITETKYEGENYRATVEGYRARLKEIEVKEKTITVTQKLAAPRWSLGVSAGPMVGYGITPRGWQPVAGAGIIVGVQYRF